jgi:hypothetical protein
VTIVGAGLLAALLLLGACRPPRFPRPPLPPRPGDGFVHPAWWRARQDDYLRFATAELQPGSILNVLAHVSRARRDRSYRPDLSAVTPAALASELARIDRMDDTTDFTMLYLINLWYAGRDLLPADTRVAIEQRMLAFKYWYTEPTPPGLTDNKWYWSENHRIIFHVIEYLAGQAFPDATFTNDGRPGRAHLADARARIEAWITEKARFGFSEWHSDVYYQKDVTPLLTLVEWAHDRALANRAAMLLDLVLFDVALHLQRGNMGVTHGRSYMKDKSRATDQDVFEIAKLAFDDTTKPYQSRGGAAAILARAERYRIPEVIRRVAVSERTMVDREHMNVPLDELAPVVDDPPAPYGYRFDDPENVPFWWERGALTVWQVVPLTLATADRYRLWDTELFRPYVELRDLTGGDPDVARRLAQALARMVALALLKEVDTYTWRSPHVMLSSAQDYRPGSFGEQYHAWQATLDEDAVVFTTHPKAWPQVGTRWPDSDGYWTGTGSMPRSAQHGAAAIHLYAPQFQPGSGPLRMFSYLPATHAYFPQERFDEVAQEGGWTFGRRGEGYVALWSWRPTRWRESQPGEFTNGLTRPFDLLAEGGADNVWVVQVGDRTRFGSFAEFRDRVRAAAPEVAPRPAVDGLPGGFDVRFVSPTEGEMRFGWTGPLVVGGRQVELHHGWRYDNPWAKVPFDTQRYTIRDGDAWLSLDFAANRRAAGTHPAR